MSKQSRTDTSLIVGRNPVREALEQEAARIEKVMLQRGGGSQSLDAVHRAAREAGVPVQFVPSGRLDHMASGLNHQGVIAVAAPMGYHDLHAVLTRVAPDLDTVRRTKPILLLLDQIEDPFNFGAILRTAVAVGVAGVIVPKQRMAPLNAAAIKASAGMAGRIPIARVDNLADVLFQLKERGFWVAGAAAKGRTTMWTMDWDRPLGLVMGSEGKGLRSRIAETCDYLVSIPLFGEAESLNVSVATAVLLYEAARVRHA